MSLQLYIIRFFNKVETVQAPRVKKKLKRLKKTAQNRL